MTHAPPRLFDALASRYVIERELGRGGMAMVYLARDLKHERPVAVKVLRPEVAAGIGAERFVREIRLSASFTHPHILPVHDSGAAEWSSGTPLLYFVMPYLPGGSLRDRIDQQGPLAVAEALRIAREIADALDYAHQRGVVHRDIKPANILFQGGHAVVADFGIARALDPAAERMTESGLILGTPAYMSPEQISADGPVDGRSDLYGLGCVLYEMLAGQPPFIARTRQAVLALHTSAPRPKVSARRPDAPPWVDAVIARAMALRPSDRYPDARALARALDPPAPAPRPPGPRPGRPWRWAGGALAAIALGTGLLLSRNGQRPAPAVGIVVLPFDNERQGEHAMLSQGLAWVPTVRPIDGAALRAGDDSTAAPEALLGRARHLGGRYLVSGSLVPAGEGVRLTADLYASADGTRLLRMQDSAPAGGGEAAMTRLALQTLGALAERESLGLGPRHSLLGATVSPSALGALLQARDRFRVSDFDGAAGALRRAIESDSGSGLAYHRLGVVETWRHDYPAALGAIGQGLRHREGMAQRWVNLLESERHYVLGQGDSAIAGFENVVLDNPDDLDGWLGLGEALFHYGAFTGHRPHDAQAAFTRLLAFDPDFAPIYHHLIDLAVLDSAADRAAEALARLPPESPYRAGEAAAVALRFGSPTARARAVARLGELDRGNLGELFRLWVHGPIDLALADTIGLALTGAERPPLDRRRGAAFRLMALLAAGRPEEAIAAWSAVDLPRQIDPWVIHASLAGHPVDSIARPMLAAARELVAERGASLAALPIWDDAQQALSAAAHEAALRGDSAAVLSVLRLLDPMPPGLDPTNPVPPALAAALRARLALLAADTASAVRELRLSVGRIAEPATWFYPLTSMAPERRLLAELQAARGEQADSDRWMASFEQSWSPGDVLFARPARR